MTKHKHIKYNKEIESKLATLKAEECNLRNHGSHLPGESDTFNGITRLLEIHDEKTTLHNLLYRPS